MLNINSEYNGYFNIAIVQQFNTIQPLNYGKPPLNPSFFLSAISSSPVLLSVSSCSMSWAAIAFSTLFLLVSCKWIMIHSGLSLFYKKHWYNNYIKYASLIIYTYR